MPKLGRIEKGYLGKLVASGHKMINDYIDMRGFDWCSVCASTRPHYYEDHLSKVDFTQSKAERGFWIEDATFEECIFDKSKWWASGFVKCKFIKCRFKNCHLYSSDLGGKYYDCSFGKLSGRGECFSFGRGSMYKSCIFESVDIHNIIDVIGVRFEDCTISGTFTNGIFRGRRYALKRRFDSVPDIFSRVYWPVKFIRCDLSNLKTQNVIFEKDVVFKDCTLGDQFSLNTSLADKQQS